MKKVICGSTALIAFAVAGPALAADIGAAPAYKVPAAVASAWSGFYAGLGLGFRAARTDAVTTSETIAGIPQNLADGRPTGASFDGLGFRTSSYVGFNWQFAPQWIAGLEGDVGFADQSTRRQSQAFSPGFSFFARPPDSLAVKTDWDASLRARLGFLLTPATLAYATGGVAWQRSEFSSICAIDGCLDFGLSPSVISASRIQAGWTVGGGIETALGGNWIARAEYRYADFGAVPFTIARTAASGSPLNSTSDNFDLKIRTHNASFGVAYKLGDPIVAGAQASLITKAAPIAMSWTGPYVGLGLGARALQANAAARSELFGGAPIPISEHAVPFNGTAFRASPYAGINWQFAPKWVAGIEGDAGFADQSATLAGYPVSAAFGTFHEAADSLVVKATWDASLRARLGFLVTPATLLFASGGAAWQHDEVISTCGSAPCRRTFSVSPSVIANSTTKLGWTIGGGLETALGHHWLARAEYRFADFGTSSYTISRTSAFAPANTIDTFDVTLRTHTATFGLAYQFN
ncbi:outer membrane beta-barrel protein [Bradyrhizobium sp. 1]|uniref:outer membrane protein n=1 Tax=Bradyrhizobium sp. 1 TaxID=241591 RepID=UPI001FF7C72F|nr:outer membrane beta-barrel protein [Bradyrhizobium sp. 1]MCK1392822.1 porin family protein [Bradyrhizobium sp. 1]